MIKLIEIKEFNPLKYADQLIETIQEKGLLEMIMSKQFTFFTLQDGTFKYYNSNGTYGSFDDVGIGRTFTIFNKKTNIIIRGDSNGKIYFDMYKQEENKWITAVDTFFVENNNKLSFHDPNESKMYFFGGETVLQIYSYSFILLNSSGEKVQTIEQAERFAILVQDIEDIELQGNPCTVIQSFFGLYIILRNKIQFYRFETKEIQDIELPKEIEELKGFTFVIHSQTSDLIFYNEKGMMYCIDSRASLLIPIHLGQLHLPKEEYSLHFYYRTLIFLCRKRMILYDIRSLKKNIQIELQKEYDISSLVSYTNADVSIGFYSNSLKTFNEFLFTEEMNYSHDMNDGMLYLLLNDFKKTLLGTYSLNEEMITRFLDRLGNDLPLIIYLSTKPEYRTYALQRFKEKYTHEYLLSMANTWNPKDIEDYFIQLEQGIPQQPIELQKMNHQEWNPSKFNMADITVQLSNHPTEEKIDKVYELLGIPNDHQGIELSDELISSIVHHQTNWLRPLIIPLMKLRPYELLQHLIIITDDLPRLDIIMIFQQVFSSIDLFKQKNTLNNDQIIVYALFLTIITSFTQALHVLDEDLLPLFMERIILFPLDKLQISYKTICFQALQKVLKSQNFQMAEILYTLLERKYTPLTIENILENILQHELQSKSPLVDVRTWLIQKISQC